MDKTPSGWEAYANQLEQDIKVAEESLSKKNQEIRDLRRQLLEKALPDTDLQKQLDHVRQQAAANRNLYQRGIHGFQQQLAATQRARDAAVQQTTALEKAHKDALLEIENLRTQLAERTQQLQRAASAPRATPGAVGYEERIAVLEKQLKLSQNENAKLLKHSDKKGNSLHDDSDDEEPEYPRPAGKKARMGQRPSNLDAGYSRPGNYSRGPTPKAKPKRSTTATPKHTAPPTPVATQQHAAASSPTATPQSTPRKTPVSIDLISDDEDQASAKNLKTAQGTRKMELPIRKSIHENITVADHSSKAQSTFASSTSSSQTLSEATAKDENPAPSKKRKRNARTPSTGTVRRRSNEQQLRAEFPDLAINAKGFEQPYSPRTQRRDSYEEDWSGDDSDDASYTASLEFRFTAICSYDGNGEATENYPSTDLEDCVGALWTRIREAEDRWQEAFGEYWMYEFTKTGKATGPVCVSQRCSKKPTNWGEREGMGKFACVDCVKAGRPCFTYVSGEDGRKGEFRLLPLRESDRTKKVVKDEETRYWVNDERLDLGGDDEMEF